jgi:hypothetical protein
MSRNSAQYFLTLGSPRARWKIAGVTSASHVPNTKRLNLRRFDDALDETTNGSDQSRRARKKISQ